MKRLLCFCTIMIVISSIAYSKNYLPGQIIVSPESPSWLVYNKDDNGDGKLDPFFMCGPGGPEGFLYGDISGDDTPATVLDEMSKHGGNCIYMQGIRSHGGDGEPTHNPFIEHDPAKGLDSQVLDQWESWFQRMEQHRIVVYFFFYDDSVDLWNGDDISSEEREYIHRIVNRFEHHPNLIWCIAEEYSESLSRKKIKKLAREIRAVDNHEHLIAVHQRKGTQFDFAEEENVEQFAMQIGAKSPKEVHQTCLTAWNEAQGRYNVNMAELHPYHSELLKSGNSEEVRKVNWAAAMAGAYVMHLGTWETRSNRKPPTATMLEDYRRLYSFMESISDLPTMSPKDNIVKSGTAWVLGNDDHFVAYLINGGDVTLDLSSITGKLAVFWYNPRKGNYITDNSATGGGNRSFTAPDNNDWVLHVKKL